VRNDEIMRNYEIILQYLYGSFSLWYHCQNCCQWKCWVAGKFEKKQQS